VLKVPGSVVTRLPALRGGREGPNGLTWRARRPSGATGHGS